MKLLSNEQLLTFDDVALVPAEFSTIISRADIDTSTEIGGTSFDLPIISSNMASVFSPKLANSLAYMGGRSVIHRFCTIEENVNLFKASRTNGTPWVSVGAKKEEIERADALVDAGANVLLLDVAMGNSMVAVNQYNLLAGKFPNCDILVSDFCLGSQINEFMSRVKKTPAAFLVGQGCGSACKTREVTGIGIPVISAINSCNAAGNYNLILNGGIRNSGDMCKALAAGCKAVILGRLFAQTTESANMCDPKFAYFNEGSAGNQPAKSRTYSGSASFLSYKSQGKQAAFRAPEGESYEVPVNTTVEELFNNFNGGLRSSMSYLNAGNLDEYREKARFVKITNAGAKESGPYGKNL